MNEVKVTVNDNIGFHARTASIFSGEAKKFKCDILVFHREKQANARSMLSLMALGVKQGAEILIRAQGEDSEQAVAALKALVEKMPGVKT